MYNVLTQEWMPMRGMDGEDTQTGVLDALLHAHEYQGLAAASPTLTYGIYRLLIAMVMDIYRPERRGDLERVFRRGKFDAALIEDYFAQCNAQGERFDLFDEAHPFLQQSESGFVRPEQAKAGKEEFVKIEPVTKLFAQLPYGNNHVHFVHSTHDSHVFSPAQCAQILCTLPCFFINYNKGGYFGITGQPPVFFLADGKNLFETLVLSLFTKVQYAEYEWGLPLWRQQKQKSDVYPITIMDGLYCPARQIRLMPNREQTEVREMQYAEGANYKPLFGEKSVIVWKDPHVCYYHKDKEEKAYKPRENRAIWRDLGVVLSATRKPLVLDNAEYVFRGMDAVIGLRSYSLVTEFKSAWMPKSWFFEEIPLLAGLVEDADAIQFFKRTLEVIDELASKYQYVIGKTLKKLSGQSDDKKAVGEFAFHADGVIQKYLFQMRRYVFETLCPQLLEDHEQAVLEQRVRHAIRPIALQVFEDFLSSIGTSARTLKWAALAKNDFERQMNICLKKGGFGSCQKAE